MNSILYVGMDVYKENYTLCCYSFDRDTKLREEYKTIKPEEIKVIEIILLNLIQRVGIIKKCVFAV